MNAFYQPVRSRIEKFDESPLVFRETKPGKGLEGLVHSFWSLKGSSACPGSLGMTVIPNGCVDLMFDRAVSDRLYISGAALPAFRMRVPVASDMFAIRFMPGRAGSFFSLPWEEICQGPIRFSYLTGNRFSEIRDRLMEAGTFEDRVDMARRFLLERLEAKEKTVHPDFLAGLELILENRGNIGGADISRETIRSPRYMRRLFKTHMGIGPKRFAEIVRFQSICERLREGPPCSYAELAAEAGYFDQAHLIKNFKHYAGETPMGFLGARL